MYINNKLTLKQIVDQLEACNFECEAGSLTTNSAFIELKELIYGKVNVDDAWIKGRKQDLSLNITVNCDCKDDVIKKLYDAVKKNFDNYLV